MTASSHRSGVIGQNGWKKSVQLAALFFLASLPACVWGQTNPGAATGFSQSNFPPGKIQDASSRTADAEAARAECLHGRRLICGRILKVLPNGLVVDSGYTDLLRPSMGQSWLIPGSVTASRATSLVEGKEPDCMAAGTVFLASLPKLRGAKPKQYDYVMIGGYPAGQYTYTSVGTITHTVRRFCTTLQEAVQLNAAAEKDKNQSPATTVK